jgi:hypothetical protein
VFEKKVFVHRKFAKNTERIFLNNPEMGRLFKQALASSQIITRRVAKLIVCPPASGANNKIIFFALSAPRR